MSLCGVLRILAKKCKTQQLSLGTLYFDNVLATKRAMLTKTLVKITTNFCTKAELLLH
jgi:hypothetical protein